MRVTLVSMPWQALDMPSLQVGLLRSVVARARRTAVVREYHGSLRWMEWLLDESDEIQPRDYVAVGIDEIFHGLGDWVFSGALYGDPDWGAARLKVYADGHGIDVSAAVAMRAHADAYIRHAAEEILAGEPTIVGFTTTFMQNTASLALAQALKRRRPDLVTVFGGSNCEGPMGHALHRNHRFVDYVVRGEGETAFPQLLDHIESEASVPVIAGLCWWDGEVSRANAASHDMVAPSGIPTPDYDEWFAALERSVVQEYVVPKLVVEGARGCWWGDRHHCTFCGLNGSSLKFRAKSGSAFWREVEHLVRRHRVLDVVTVDNIMSMEFFRTFLPMAASSGWDLRMHYEVKSNLTIAQMAALRDGGVCQIQPGIESLNSRVLDLMDKGVSGLRNVRTLRECENHGLTCEWNYLYGFPGEIDDDYASVVEQIPALVHLQPPGAISRIALHRFSPYFTRPDLGFVDRRPAKMYGHVYDLPDSELSDLVYLFDAPEAGIGAPAVAVLKQAIADWVMRHPASWLWREPAEGGELVVHDERVGWPSRAHVFTGWQAAAFAELEQGRTLGAVRHRLGQQQMQVSGGDLAGWVAELRAMGLVFQDKDAFISLPTWTKPIRLIAQNPGDPLVGQA